MDMLTITSVSFDAWPGPNELHMTTGEDKKYQQALGSKTYMMGVSPYFYSRLSALGKNWYSSSDSLWYDRWMQVLDVLPDMVQIISCKYLPWSLHTGGVLTSPRE
jgi:glucan endo-1,3-alpha-glucosidase